MEGKHPCTEENVLLKASFDGVQISMAYNLCGKTNLDGKDPLLEDECQWKTTFDGGQPLIKLQKQEPSFFSFYLA